ncbi:MAG: tetraacyldisaccharide 4'-kinase [Flavobacteriaceae bacterium]
MPFFSPLLWPISLIYQLVVYVRNALYDWGWLKSYRPNVNSLAVGNLSVGGSGKTPMIEFILRYCIEDHRVAVISRGYKRKSKGFRRVSDSDTALTVGDEPLQLYQQFKSQVTVAVDTDRLNAIEQLLKSETLQAVILDDAFQHRRIRASLNLLLTTYQRPFYDDHYLPMGRLRDHKNQLKRADFVLVTKCPEQLNLAEAEAIRARINRQCSKEVFFACSRYSQQFLSRLPLLANQRIALITGLADAQQLKGDLLRLGLTFDFFEKPDHHHYADSDINALKDYTCVLTTSKDEVKLAPLWNDCLPPRVIVEVEHQLLFDGHTQFVKRIKESLFDRKPEVC